MSEPHRCPVCEGSGRQVDPRTREWVNCNACEGRGIVWEPQEAAVQGTEDNLDLTYDGDGDAEHA